MTPLKEIHSTVNGEDSPSKGRMGQQNISTNTKKISKRFTGLDLSL